MNALLLIDLQNDFLPGGALAVPDGDAVIPFANLGMEFVELVVATQDWHPPNHGSFASQHSGVSIGETFLLDGIEQTAWPDHCVQGTVGAEFSPSLNLSRIDHVVQKGTNPTIDSYSGFFDNGHRQSTGLDALLRDRGVTTLTIMGLATDYCVMFTVLDALQLRYRVRLLLDGCRGVNLRPGDVQNAVERMALAGAEVITSTR
jgi:nicotinamidase/pyrazinamidase